MEWLLNTVRPIIPTAEVTDFRFVSFSREKADFSIVVTLKNPGFLPIPLAGANYFFESRNKCPVWGSLDGLKTIEAHSSSTIAVPISILYSKIIDFFGDIKPGSVVPYKATVDIVLRLPVVKSFIVPVKKEGEFVMPFVPAIRLREIETVGKVSNDELKVKVGFEVENENEYGVMFNGLEFGVLAERGKKVAFLKVDGGKVEIKKKGSGFVRVLVCLRVEDIVLGWWGGKKFVFYGEVDVDTPWGQFKSPFK